MQIERQNKCYIITASGLETKPILDALRQLEVTTSSAAELSPVGYAEPQSLRRTFKATDFVIAVVSGGIDSAVFFELGVAVGLNKPAFLIFTGVDEAPFALQKIPSVRVASLDEPVIHFHLKQFINQLRHRTATSTVRATNQHRRKKLKFSEWLSSEATAQNEQELEVQISEALRAAGVVTSIEPVLSSKLGSKFQPDFIAWFDGIPDSLGNPVILEIKKNDVSAGAAARNQVISYVKAAGVRTGLLIIDSIEDHEIRVTSKDDGYVFELSSRRLLSELANQSLYATLLKERNLFAHGLRS